MEVGDDDVGCHRVGESNGRETIGGKLCQVRTLVTGNMGEMGIEDSLLGSKQKEPGNYLMPALTCDGGQSHADLESCVADSMEKKKEGPNEVKENSNTTGKQKVLGSDKDQAQERSEPQNRPACGKGPLPLGSGDANEPNQACQENMLSPVQNQQIQSANNTMKNDGIQGITLMVDLNDAECRKRRRRQMSNLVQMYEEMEEEEDSIEEEDISSNSNNCVEDNSQKIEEEVKATMAVGAQLNMKFKDNDSKILKKMIALEMKESVDSQRRVEGT